MTGTPQPPWPTQLAVLDMGGTTIRDDGIVGQALAQAVQFASLEAITLGTAKKRVADASSLRGAAKIDLLMAALGGEERSARRALGRLDVLLHQAIDDGALQAMPGAGDVLAWLHDRGIKVCLATGFTPDIRRHLLEARGWTNLVDLALSPEDAGRGRPHPDMILVAADRFAVSSSEAVAVVGDTTNDLLAGTSAGAGIVVGVLSGAHSRDLLTQAPHTHLIDNIAGLPAVLVERHQALG